MPGRYAAIMIAEQVHGRYPPEALTWMLHRNTFMNNETTNQRFMTELAYNDAAAMASCHPNAIMFMNIVTNVNWANDYHPVVMVNGLPAINMVNTAANAINLDNNAMWVKYGGHSFILLSGTGGQVESLEAWAGGGGGQWFHDTVLRRADEKRPTRAAAGTALRHLVDAGGPHNDPNNPRTLASLVLSRAGYGGFDEEAGVPDLHIVTAPMVTEADFRNRVRTRLQEVGWCIARAKETGAIGGNVCCRCQTRLANLNHSRWRVCGTAACQRKYCQNCKRLLRWGTVWTRAGRLPIPTRQRLCDGGHATTRQ